MATTASVDAIARALPQVEQGIACAGTALESRTYQVRKKTFLFLSAKELRLKLEASAAEARERGVRVGASGWATLPLADLPSVAVLRRWIQESHALLLGPARKPKAEGKGRASKRRGGSTSS